MLMRFRLVGGVVLIFGSVLAAAGIAPATGTQLPSWFVVVGLLLCVATALVVYRHVGPGLDHCAAAIRSHREAREQATLSAEKQSVSHRPHPMTHASSPFKKRSSSSLSRRLTGRFRQE